MSKLRKYLWVTLGVIAILSLAALVIGTPVSEDFNTTAAWQPPPARNTYFAKGYYNGFRMVDAMRDTVNGFVSTGRVHSIPWSVRLRNQALPDSVTTHVPYIEYISSNADSAGKDGGVGTFSFWWKKWSLTTGNRFKMSYNMNGAGWVDFDSVSTGVVSDTSWYNYSKNLNLAGDNIKLRVTNQVGFPSSSSLAAQLDLDDFSITDFSGSTPLTISSVTQISTTNLDVLFSRAVATPSSDSTAAYKLNPGGVNQSPTTATRDGSNYSLVHLAFSSLVAGFDSLFANGVMDTTVQQIRCVNTKGYVTVDLTQPTLVSVNPVDNGTLDVTFSEAVDLTTAQTLLNYSVDGGVGNPATATRQTNQAVVRLTFNPFMDYGSYSLSVSNVTDRFGNVMVPGSLPFTLVRPPIIFTEIMPNPALIGLADSSGEWFEIYNTGSSLINMAGWIIGDKTGGSYTLVGPVSIASHQYFVFGSNDTLTQNGGVPVNYQYHYRTYGTTVGLQLTNVADSIWIRDASNVPVIALKYNQNFGFGAGISAQLSDVNLDYRIASNWCRCAQSWPGAYLNDKGTPGQVNVCDPTQGTVQTICAIKTEDNCGILYYTDMRVKTQGVVTYVNSCTTDLFIEDNNCGVMVYGRAVNYNMTNAARPAQVGDVVVVDGFLANYNGLAEFDSSLTTGLQVTITLAGSGSVPGAVTVPASAVQWHVNNCNAEQWESRLILVDSLQFGETGNFVASHNYNMISPSGDSVQFRTQSSACEPLVGTAIPTGIFTFQGILSQYNKAACYCDSFQCIKGRTTLFTPLCSTPVELTAYCVGLDSVGLRWSPGVDQGCNCYSIYYCDTQDGTYTLLANVTGVTEYVDTSYPDPLQGLRFYKVIAGGQGCQ